MSHDLAVSMDELEQQSAELLPSRETLYACKYSPSHASFTSIFSQQAGNAAAVGGLIGGIAIGGSNINIVL